ncbi:AAA family ATPase [Marinospirillum sp. MEB164]|uniref:AAA family ATPase n=1 Tax=Marinospirillum alkalitolerans TaxID=3123374 RepID=A0ABW8PT83_9GAMM
MQSWEPSLGGDSTPTDFSQLLSHVQDSAVFYPGRQHGKHLDLLLHLSRYSNLFLLLTGPEGSGKSHLKQRLLNQIDSGVVATSLRGEQVAQANSLLTQLTHQLDLVIPPRAEAEDYCNAIRDFSAQLNEEGGSCLIVIDDAELLEQDALDILLDLANTTPDQRRPHIALFGRHDLFQRLSSEPNASRFEAAGHHLPLHALSEVEARGYLEHRCHSVGIDHLPLDDQQFMRVYKKARGLPGFLNTGIVEELKATQNQPAAPTQDIALAAEKPPAKKAVAQKKSTPKKPAKPLPWIPIGAAVGGLALLTLVFLYQDRLFSTPTPDTSLISRSQEVRQQNWAEINNLDLPALAEPAQVDLTDAAPAPATTEPEPEPATASAPMDSPDDAPPSSSRPPEPLQPVAPAEVTQAATPPAPAARTETRPAPSAAEQPAGFQNQGLKREAWLMERNPNHFALQMMGSLEEASVRQFIQQANQSGLVYFEGRYQGNPWFVVVYGDYANRDAAVAAIPNLPEALRNQRPWARSFASIQNDLRSR